MAVTYKKYDRDDFQVLDGNHVVAHALRMTSGEWGLFDADGLRIFGKLFPTPRKAVQGFYPDAKLVRQTEHAR